MRILTGDKGPVHIFFVYGPINHALHLGIHRIVPIVGTFAALVEISRPLVPLHFDRALVVYTARRVVFTYPIGGAIVVRPIAALVAERPGNNAGVVDIAYHHALDAL